MHDGGNEVKKESKTTVLMAWMCVIMCVVLMFYITDRIITVKHAKQAYWLESGTIIRVNEEGVMWIEVQVDNVNYPLNMWDLLNFHETKQTFKIYNLQDGVDNPYTLSSYVGCQIIFWRNYNYTDLRIEQIVEPAKADFVTYGDYEGNVSRLEVISDTSILTEWDKVLNDKYVVEVWVGGGSLIVTRLSDRALEQLSFTTAWGKAYVHVEGIGSSRLVEVIEFTELLEG